MKYKKPLKTPAKKKAVKRVGKVTTAPLTHSELTHAMARLALQVVELNHKLGETITQLNTITDFLNATDELETEISGPQDEPETELSLAHEVDPIDPMMQ